jgi:hypothetical protein
MCYCEKKLYNLISNGVWGTGPGSISELENKYAHALDNHGQSCFVRSDFFKMKCVCKTQMMPPPDHQNPVDMHTSIMCIWIVRLTPTVLELKL